MTNSKSPLPRSKLMRLAGALTPVVAVLSMGIAMPSCPGQQAMQQQLDTLNSKQTELDKQVQAQNAQLATLNKDLGEARALLAQVSQTVEAQKPAVEQLDASVKELTEKVTALASRPAAPAAKKGRR